MSDTRVDTRFAFQPVVNLHTGGVVALEMLARPPHGDVQTLLWSAARAGRLEKLDVALAVAAVHRWAPAAGAPVWSASERWYGGWPR